MKWFQRCLNHLNLSHLALHTFVDSFAGCYKDGTEPGTRDYRYFAALFLFLRMFFYLLYQAILTAYFYGWSGLTLVGFTILLIITQPYNSMYNKYNTVTMVIFGVMTLIVIALMNVNIALVKAHHDVKFSAITVATLLALPQLYAIKMAIKGICKQDIIRKLFSKNKMFKRSLSETSLLVASENRTQSYKSLTHNMKSP